MGFFFSTTINGILILCSGLNLQMTLSYSLYSRPRFEKNSFSSSHLTEDLCNYFVLRMDWIWQEKIRKECFIFQHIQQKKKNLLCCWPLVIGREPCWEVFSFLEVFKVLFFSLRESLRVFKLALRLVLELLLWAVFARVYKDMADIDSLFSLLDLS